jgi:hypothetical protein
VSIRVDPARIDERLGGRDFVYVLTVRDGGVHAVAHRFEVDGPVVSVPTASQSVKDRMAVDDRVTLLWPPVSTPVDEYDDYSLVADGAGEVSDGSLRVTLASVLLHRPAP